MHKNVSKAKPLKPKLRIVIDWRCGDCGQLIPDHPTKPHQCIRCHGFNIHKAFEGEDIDDAENLA